MIDNTVPRGFRCVPVNLRKLSQKIIDNSEICKILYYMDRDCLKKPELSDELKQELIEQEYVQIMPQIKVDDKNSAKNYIHISFDYFSKNTNNPEFLDSILIINILCHNDSLKILDNFNEITLRDYELAYLINKEIDGKKFTGIGKADFLSGESFMLRAYPDYVGFTLKYEFIDSK